jgi:hypothetical protein
MNLYKLNRIVHRDLGYLFFGMLIIYAVSGIALNHKNDFNPNYIITKQEFKYILKDTSKVFDKAEALKILKTVGEADNYKKHYFPYENTVKIFIKGGSIVFNYKTGKGFVEKIKRRPILFEFNFLHYNPGKLWLWFSDFFALAMFLLALSGLFVLKGKNGITGRGAWLTSIGIIIPAIFLILYL